MKNLFKESEFMLGVTKFKNLPEDEGVEILLAGRSNAGKSSALNALTENPKLARISKTPGRTTEINYFRVNETLKFVDLPGYGFAKSSFHKRKDWAPLLEEYFAKRQSPLTLLFNMLKNTFARRLRRLPVHDEQGVGVQPLLHLRGRRRHC